MKKWRMRRVDKSMGPNYITAYHYQGFRISGSIEGARLIQVLNQGGFRC